MLTKKCLHHRFLIQLVIVILLFGCVVVYYYPMVLEKLSFFRSSYKTDIINFGSLMKKVYLYVSQHVSKQFWRHFKNLYPVMHETFTYKKVMMQFCTVFVTFRLKSCNLWLKVLPYFPAHKTHFFSPKM